MSTSERGLLISFEGNDGSGKSTQLRLLAERLEQQGFDVVQNAEPGGTRIGQQIRRILLNPAHDEISPVTELLLMFASRAQAAAEIIEPALESGAIVLTDRFTDASLAYQGVARGLGFDAVRDLHRLTLGTLMPALTLCIELDLELSMARAQHRNSDSAGKNDETRFDEQSLAFHRRVREGYHRIALEEPDRFVILDGSGLRGEVADRVWAIVGPRIRKITGVGQQAL